MLPQYGWVILVGIASAFLLTWQSLQVVKMRKKFNIEYPTMYSSDNDLFNCYQMAHQSTYVTSYRFWRICFNEVMVSLNRLELYPKFLMMLFLGGLYYPIVTALAGIVWIVGRVMYSLGYYTGGITANIANYWDTHALNAYVLTVTTNRSFQKDEGIIQHLGNVYYAWHYIVFCLYAFGLLLKVKIAHIMISSSNSPFCNHHGCPVWNVCIVCFN